jgi:hypothetical protein
LIPVHGVSQGLRIVDCELIANDQGVLLGLCFVANRESDKGRQQSRSAWSFSTLFGKSELTGPLYCAERASSSQKALVSHAAMKTIFSALIALSVLATAAAPANAVEQQQNEFIQSSGVGSGSGG